MNSDWQHCNLGDVLTLQRGYDLPNQSRREGAIPIVSSSGVTGYHNEAKQFGPGVVTGRYGTLGEVFFIESEYWPLNTTLFVRDFKGNDPRFLSYFLRTLCLESQNAAGAVPGLNRNALHLLPVAIPSVPTQRRIASILSAYDNLIENNTRRIAILEEMARSLYREWLVDFRFPGHEQVPMVESEIGPVPEDWQVNKLGDVIELAYGRALRASDRSGGTVPVWGSSGVVGYHDTPLVQGPGIVVGRKGNVGTVFWSDVDFFVIDTAFFVRTDLPLKYVYYNLLLDQVFLNGDAAVPGLNRNQAYLNEFKVPPRDVLGAFDEWLEPVFAQARILKVQLENLRQTRDLLLPELVSGRVQLDTFGDLATNVLSENSQVHD